MKKIDSVTTIAIIVIAILTILLCYLVCERQLVKVEKVVEVVKNTAEELNSEEEIVYNEDTKEEKNSIEEGKEVRTFVIALLLDFCGILSLIAALIVMRKVIKSMA